MIKRFENASGTHDYTDLFLGFLENKIRRALSYDPYTIAHVMLLFNTSGTFKPSQNTLHTIKWRSRWNVIATGPIDLELASQNRSQ